MRKVLPVAVVMVAAMVSVWPMIRCPGCVSGIGRDGLLINWIINTTGKNLYGINSGVYRGIFDGSIFYPYRNVLAYSDMHSLTALWTFPIASLEHDPGVVSGLALVAGQVLTMVVIFGWWKKISGDSWGAAVAAIAFGLSQIRFVYQVHLQMWSMQYFLIASWLIISWIDDNRNWKLYAGAVLLGMQVWESLLPVYFAALVVMTYVVISRKFLTVNHYEKVKNIMIAGLLSLVVAAPPLLAYWGIGREFNYQRSIRDAANFSLAVNDIWGQFASPGLYILFLVAIVKIGAKLKSQSSGPQFTSQYLKGARWLVVVLITSLILAFGPVVKWGSKTVKIAGKIPIPLPYAVAYYTVPGFGALRTPSRWIWLAGWAASGLVALGIGSRKKGIVWGSLLLVALVGGKGITKIRQVPTAAQTPGVYKWLADKPAEAVAILPMYPDEREIERLPFSYVHGKDTLNGFSGFYPPRRIEEAIRWTESFPDYEVLAEMKAYGTDYVVAEKDQLPITKERNLKIEYEDKDYVVYKL